MLAREATSWILQRPPMNNLGCSRAPVRTSDDAVLRSVDIAYCPAVGLREALFMVVSEIDMNQHQFQDTGKL